MAILCENTPHLNPEQWKKLEDSTVSLSEERKKEIEEVKKNTALHSDGKVTINL